MSGIMKTKTVHMKHHLDEGIPGPDDFEIIETTLPAVDDGGILLQLLYISADPYLRGQLKSKALQPKKVGDPMVGFVSGKVLISKSANYKVGDLVGTNLAFSTYVVLSAKQLESALIWKLTDILKEEELSLGIGLLGMPGSTAYGGLLDVLRPLKGETIFVSAASGAVGSLVGMIAKREFGCFVIGSCGGPEKCKIIKEKFGFDVAIDYKVADNKEKLKAALAEAAPKGLNMYFENVGGYHFEAAYELLAPYGRIAVCGGISQYNEAEMPKLAFNPMTMVYTFQRIEGFVCSPWLSGKKGNFLADMNKWRLEGKLVAEETVFHGIESWPLAFRSLFTGEKLGKVVVSTATTH